MHRSEEPGNPRADDPPPLPDDVSREEVQLPAAGAGPLFHRVYRARIRDAQLTPEALVDSITADLDVVAPSEFASFVKVLGDEGAMAVGDEYVVRMPGPWDGPVRVIERTANSFRFVTLDGHLEAGQIRFAARRSELLEFQIESWARAGDRLSNLLYHHLRMSKEVQLHMWSSVLERVAKLAGGRLTGGIEIRTRRVDIDERGRHFDALSQQLPREPPGAPVPGGPWQVARRLIEEYRMADPAIVRADWDPRAALMGREMSLALRLYRIVRVRVRVRVTRVWDEERMVDGRLARVFGYEYAALPGHVEVGRMDYEVYKWLDDGSVEFRLHARSRAADDIALPVRLGYRLFGRREQVRFHLRCCQRMARLTARELGRPDDLPPPAVRLDEAVSGGDPLRGGERIDVEQMRSGGRGELGRGAGAGDPERDRVREAP
jgi:uncharacterized protein (UPF0548 family)